MKTETKPEKFTEVVVKRTITKDDLIDMIITALEGGSNYWYWIKPEEFENELPEKAGDYNTLSEKIGEALFSNPKFELPVYDKENQDELLGKVTQESCKRAFKLMNEKYPESVDNIIEKHYDANDADIFFQLATMGKIVFG